MSHVGIPIGNLTSQIFANIYLHEFDRYVRQALKPLAYLRYGDDFILITATRKQAFAHRQAAAAFLQSMGLYIHKRNDVVVPVQSGLHFLGHVAGMDGYGVDRVTSAKALKKISALNLSSYTALKLTREVKSELYWRVLDDIDEMT